MEPGIPSLNIYKDFLSFTLNSLIKTLFYTALISLAVLVIVVFLTPIAFTACSADSYWCRIAYALTTSGGPIGFSALLLATGLGYASSQSTVKDKVTTFFKATGSLVLFFLLLAILNERYTKHFLKLQRPSHRLMLTQTGRINEIDSLYMLDKDSRKLYFEQLTVTHPESFDGFDKTIVAHWVEEAGFSFPSGHTFNAFLFAMILGYAIWFTRSRPQWRFWFLLPFLWAILVGVSRVAVGAHSALDVSVGAGLGILIGGFFLKIDITRYWLTRKKTIT